MIRENTKRKNTNVRFCIDNIRPKFEGVYLTKRKGWVGKTAVLAKEEVSHGFDRIWNPDCSIHTDSAVTVPSLRGRTSRVPQSRKRISCASQDVCFTCIIQTHNQTSRTDWKANPQCSEGHHTNTQTQTHTYPHIHTNT